jgi:hypothetical protein
MCGYIYIYIYVCVGSQGQCLKMAKIKFEEQNDVFVCSSGWRSLKLIENQSSRIKDRHGSESIWLLTGLSSTPASHKRPEAQF